MVRKAILSIFSRESRSMHETAYVLAILALSSQLLALLRDRLLAGSFGTGGTLDLYYAAFRIPDFLFATIASLLSLYALLPTLVRLEEHEKGAMTSFLEQLLLLFFVVMGLIAAVVAIFAPYILPYLAPGLATGPLTLLVRIMLLQPILLGASNMLASFTQLRHRFVLYAISPLLYNLGIIFGMLALYPEFGVAGLAWGVVLGAALHLIVQLPFFLQEQPRAPWRAWRAVWRDARAVLLLSIPRTLSLAAGQISLLVIIGLASFLAAGSITVFTLAYNLQSVPLAIIGVSYSVAAFPTLAHLFAKGDRETFVAHLESALHHVIFWTVPALVMIVVLRAQLVRVILGSGAFDWHATRLTAATLALLVISLTAQSISLLVARAYYAAGESRKPFLFGVAEVTTTLLSAFALVWCFHASPSLRFFLEDLLRVDDLAGTTVLMLAVAVSLGAFVRVGFGLTFLVRDFKIAVAPLRRLTGQTFAAAILGGFAAYETLQISALFIDNRSLLGIIVQGFLAGICGLLMHALVLYLLENKELREVLGAARRKLVDAAPVAVEPTEITS